MLRFIPTHQRISLRWAGVFTLTALTLVASAEAADPDPVSAFRGEILPLLKGKCFDCHADGESKGGVSFDGFASEEALLADKDLWYRALKNVRDGLMPPPDKEQPTPAERTSLAAWVKRDVFRLDPQSPDPGQVILRRLNRVEYRNTIRDLLNVEFRTDEEFPADDTGHGFDNIGEVLNISPMLLEKYLGAAKTIVSKAVPLQGKTMPEFTIQGDAFFREEPREPLAMLSYNLAASTTATTKVKHDGHYTVKFKLSGHEDFVEGEPDGNRCKVIFKLDGTDVGERELSTMAGREFGYDFPAAWSAGEHRLLLEVQPLTPNEKQARKLRLRIDSVVVSGPHEPEHWIKPANYDRWFPQNIPAEPAARLALAQEMLGKFATRAFRRPTDEATAVRLSTLAESVYSQPDKNFEAGIGRAMEAVLASPRFIFREEPIELEVADGFPFIDEYALASRLSYFLWSTMPDEELLRLAGEKKLRAQLGEQFQRLFKNDRSQAFIRNFVGQWLEARDIEEVPIDVRFVLQREQPPDPELEEARKRYFELRRKDTATLTQVETDELEKGRALFRKRFDKFKNQEFRGDLRRDMRRETEKYFEHVVRQDRPLTELISSDYTFLNQRLAEHYGIPDVRGEEIRQVTLPADSQRGGLLTQGTVLAVTSNPTRTSPVKRGLFILDNILGSPPPPPPANVPPLEDFSAGKGTEGTLRENLAKHRADAKCASCHNRMDPIGLALENFNAMGKWRDFERGKPIESQGQLSATETFFSARELKAILVSNHRESFERCVTQKLLTYALGRGLDFHDETTIDLILQRLQQNGGRAGTLLQAIVESDAFLKRRPAAGDKPKTAQH